MPTFFSGQLPIGLVQGRPPRNDLTGTEIGWLTVVSFAGRLKIRNALWRAYWQCRCKCGVTCYVDQSGLLCRKRKFPASCGCFRATPEFYAQFERPQQRGNANPRWAGYEEFFSSWWSHFIRGAVKRDIVFRLTIQQGWDLFVTQERRCALTGIVLTLPTSAKARACTASLDRIDSRLGYVPGNVQWVHKNINRMKGDLDEVRFIALCRLVAENQGELECGSNEFCLPTSVLIGSST